MTVYTGLAIRLLSEGYAPSQVDQKKGGCCAEHQHTLPGIVSLASVKHSSVIKHISNTSAVFFDGKRFYKPYQKHFNSTGWSASLFKITALNKRIAYTSKNVEVLYLIPAIHFPAGHQSSLNSHGKVAVLYSCFLIGLWRLQPHPTCGRPAPIKTVQAAPREELTSETHTHSSPGCQTYLLNYWFLTSCYLVMANPWTQSTLELKHWKAFWRGKGADIYSSMKGVNFNLT